MKDILSGIFAYGKAINLVNKLGLWRYVFVPGLISLALAVGLFLMAYGLSDNIGTWLAQWYPWEWGSSIVQTLADVFGGLLVLAVGLIIFKQVVMIVTGPFMSPLSERIEAHYLGTYHQLPKGWKAQGYQVVRGIRIAVRNLFWELLFTVLLLLLGLIPIFTPFTTLLIFIVQAYYFGFGNLDFALERDFNYSNTIKFVQNNRGMAVGNGLITAGLLMTVVGFIFILPLGVAAATIEKTRKV